MKKQKNTTLSKITFPKDLRTSQATPSGQLEMSCQAHHPMAPRLAMALSGSNGCCAKKVGEIWWNPIEILKNRTK